MSQENNSAGQRRADPGGVTTCQQISWLTVRGCSVCARSAFGKLARRPPHSLSAIGSLN